LEVSDETLMTAYVKESDEGAFADLFRRYASRLAAFFARTVIPPNIAHDLVQQTFLQVHRARNDFRLGALFRPWVYTIALNLRREHHRRRFRKPERQFEPERHPEPSQDARVTSVCDRLVQRALLNLNEGQREVLVLHWYEEYTFTEIAHMLGASVSAVKVRAHRGYQRLKVALKEAPDE
jgi:RNA polymerase sigma-70 factor (ECF subfamily)